MFAISQSISVFAINKSIGMLAINIALDMLAGYQWNDRHIGYQSIKRQVGNQSTCWLLSIIYQTAYWLSVNRQIPIRTAITRGHTLGHSIQSEYQDQATRATAYMDSTPTYLQQEKTNIQQCTANKYSVSDLDPGFLVDLGFKYPDQDPSVFCFSLSFLTS